MIHYAEPLAAGWRRMTKALFKPFDIKKWFVVGFTAFLAGLMDFAGNSGGKSKFGNNFDAYDFFHFPETAREWLMDNPLWASVILIGVVIVIVLFIVFTWLGSRGKFMFLNNVVHDKAEVSKPWYEYSSEGNSLFIWRLIYGLLVAAVIITYFVAGFNIAYNVYYDEYSTATSGFLIAGGAILVLATMILFMYIECFLDNFVVQIMYKNRVSAMVGWGKFFTILFPNLGYFILFGLLKFLLIVAMVIGIFFVGLLTCCVGFIFLVLPYIRDVVLLPFSYTFRAFSIEFLEQFGDNYKLFPDVKPGLENGEAIVE